MAIFGVINTADGGDTFYEGMVKAKDNFATLETEITDARDGKASTHAAIAEKVTGPSTNTADYVPQWNGTNSKTLKNGFAVTAAGKALLDDELAANQLETLGIPGIMSQSGYNKTASSGNTLSIGYVSVGDVLLINAVGSVTGATPGGKMVVSIYDYDLDTPKIVFGEDLDVAAGYYVVDSTGVSCGALS